MGVTVKLRWKRYLNELRFVHEELQLIGELVKTTGGDFQTHYEKFCTKNNLDRGALNKAHSQRLQELYKTETDPNHNESPQLNADIDGALVPHQLPFTDSINSAPTEKMESTPQDEREIHEAFNKIFKKLALLLHPDALPPEVTETERKERSDLFTQAKTALEEKRYFVLLEIATQFNIATPRNYRQQIRWMKKELERLNQKLQKEKDTYNYRFGECETESEKDALIRKFMIQIFGPQIFNNNA